MPDQPANNHFATILDQKQNLTTELYPHLTDYKFDAVPLIWISDAPIKTLYETYLSITLETLESFMIDAIQEAIPAITNKQLLRNAYAFCEQEQNHSDQHAKFNQKLQTLGIDVDNLRQKQKQFTQKLAQLPLDERLQITAFIEGITAGFAYELICNRFLNEDWHPQTKDLYLWHCIEEYEHRCLAFDVYLAKVKVHKPSIILITRSITPLFFNSLIFMLKNLKKHRLLWNIYTFKDVFWFIGPRGPIFYIFKCYYRFFRKSYNPQFIYSNPKIEAAAFEWEQDFHR